MNELKNKEIENYLKNEVEQAKLKLATDKQNKPLNNNISIEAIKQINSYSYYDYISPFHLILNTRDKLPIGDGSLNYLSNFNYYSLLRYQFCHLLNKKYQKYLTLTEKKEILSIEKTYFTYNMIFYSASLIFLLFRPIRSQHNQFLYLINFYLSAYIFYSANALSMALIKNKLIPIRDRINKLDDGKKFTKDEMDLLDETIIPDWKAYLYFYKLL
jgi:hypothetical protein